MRKEMACVAICALAMAGTVLADEEGKADLRIQRVALFKNGIGFFTAGATLPADAVTVDLGQMPVPALGTFWVHYPEEVKLKGLFTRLEETEREIPVSSILEMLRANEGAKVEIMTNLEQMESIRGTIVSVGEPEVRPEPSPYVMSPRGGPGTGWRGGAVVLLRTEGDRIVALGAGIIVGAGFLDGEAAATSKEKQKQAAVRLELTDAAGGQEISVNYLARGITWVPSYQIDLSNPEKARLTAKALVMNEVADLDGVTIDLVTGFPHIKFADVNSPMAMTEDLAEFLKALDQGRSQGDRGRASVMRQANVAVYFDEDVAIADYSAALKGRTAEDLFLYPVESLTLARGETAYVPLFTQELDYEHIYTWKIDDLLDAQEPPEQEEVWHSCRLKNSMSMPWTTGAAEFVKDGQFIGQDVCHYTAPGTETTVRITRAMNVVADQNEIEVARERNHTVIQGCSYDLVTLAGELLVLNKTGKKVTVEIQKDLSGEVLETSHDARDVKLAHGLKKVNPRHTLTWTIELEPDKEQKVTYRYSVLIRG